MKPTPIKRILLVIAILLVLLLLMSSLAQAQTPAQGVQITDDRGRVVALPQPPQRIVTLLPSLAETVCALGACQRLVGVDRYTNWPDSVKQLPQVGGGIDPNIEAIVALRPDVVLMATSSRAAERLRPADGGCGRTADRDRDGRSAHKLLERHMRISLLLDRLAARLSGKVQ